LPYNHRIYPEYSLSYLSLCGAINVSDCLHAAKAIATDPAFDPNLQFLWDFSDVTSFEGGFQDVSNFVSQRIRLLGHDSLHPNNLMIAQEDTMFGVARMYQQLVESRGLPAPQTVRSYEEAGVVVGLPPETLMSMRGALQPPLPAE
jgi:hypothetical protein